MLLNTEKQVICIPLEKKSKATLLLADLITSTKTTVLKIQQLTGLLNFMCKAIFPAWSYTRRYYAKITNLKQYHHLRVDKEMKDDARMWLTFLNSGNSVNRPFVDFKETISAKELDFFSDASGSKNKGGLGCFFNGRWCFANWDYQFMIDKNPSIEYL